MSTWSSEKVKINKNVQHWIMCIRMCERAKIGDIKEQTYREKNSKARNGPVDPPTAGISASITVICIIISRWPWLFHEENKWKQVYRDVLWLNTSLFFALARWEVARQKKKEKKRHVSVFRAAGRSSGTIFARCIPEMQRCHAACAIFSRCAHVRALTARAPIPRKLPNADY